MEENFKYFTNALNNYAVFEGKESRKSYWMFFLIYFVLYAVTGFVSFWLSVIFTLGMLVPSISIATRRLHDTGRSGWWQLVVLIPVLGWIAIIVLLALPSKEENQTTIDNSNEAQTNA